MSKDWDNPDNEDDYSKKQPYFETLTEKLQEEIEDILLNERGIQSKLRNAQDDDTKYVRSLTLRNILQEDYKLRVTQEEVEAFAGINDSLVKKGQVDHRALMEAVKER